MRILIVNKILDKVNIGRAPLGCLYLASSLKKAGHEVKFVDACRYNKVREFVRGYQPEVLLFSVKTGFHQYYLKMNRKLKEEFNFYSIFGGPHTTFFPDTVREYGVDAICIGEGEEALVEFLNRKDKRYTKNFWVKEDGKIYKNQVRSLVEDLDTLPFPDRDSFNDYKSVRKFRLRNFIASRGCPFNCTYCFNEQYFSIYKGKGKRVRRRSVDNVVAEIEKEKHSYPFDIVQFDDDIFPASTEWLDEFRQKYTRRVNLPFICLLRPEMITDEVARLLKASGCATVCMGLETKNAQIREKLLNRKLSDKQMVMAMDNLKRHNIKVSIEVMIGLPDSSLSNDLESLEFCVKQRPNYVSSSIYQPYPGTELGDRIIKAKQWSGNYNAIGDYFDSTCLNLNNKKEIENLQQLFSLIVKFPILKRFTLQLIRLPIKKVYIIIHFLLKGYIFSKELCPMKTQRYWLVYIYRMLFR